MPQDIPAQVAPSSIPSILPEENEQQKMFSFSDARVHLKRIVDDWNTEIEDTEVRRKTRKLEIDTEGLRQKGELDEDETFIPIRTIHSNIIREQPPYINYIKNSRRIAIFRAIEDPNKNCDLLEQAFTEVATYAGWEKPLYKSLDGSQSHGWDSVEVVLDESMPGHFSIEHVSHDKLLFPRSAIDLQQCPRLIRCYDITFIMLQRWISQYGWSKEQIDLILKSRKETPKENETIRIYKLYFKAPQQINGKMKFVVQVAWFTLTDGVMDWLKQPEQLYCGIDELDPQTGQWVNKPMEIYPIFILPYQITEEAKITDHKGRCFLDEARQEAMTALWSSFINQTQRSTNIYASPSQEDGTGSSLKEIEDVKLYNSKILNRPLNFWSPPAPGADILRILQYSDTANSQETGQIDFATMNREDSRKTAKEIGAAQQQQGLLNSVQLTLFSTFIREIYSFAWLIVQSQALQQKIKFLSSVQTINVPNPLVPGQTIPQQTEVNNAEVIGKTYTVRAAGDVDVILKQELEQKFQQDWPVIQQTPLAMQFLSDYIKIRYPEKGDQYAAMLQQQDLHPLVAQLTMALSGLIKDVPEEMHKLPPEQVEQMTQLIQQGNQVVQQMQQQQQQQQKQK